MALQVEGEFVNAWNWGHGDTRGYKIFIVYFKAAWNIIRLNFYFGYAVYVDWHNYPVASMLVDTRDIK